LPSEWPDGGHDASVDWENFNRQSDTNIAPDSPAFGPRALVEENKAPVFISNLGRFFSETELGRVFDPLMWEEDAGGGTIRWASEIASRRIDPSNTLGGGNTLRIGRPEHERFYDFEPEVALSDTSVHAVRLRDLFHCGIPSSSEQSEIEGPLRLVEGHVNVNTAPRNVLRSLVAGKLVSDPEIAKQSRGHDERDTLAPRVIDRDVSAPSQSVEADIVADAIIDGRPYLSPGELAFVTSAKTHEGSGSEKEQLFGNSNFVPDGENLQWNDQAAEESFARLYNSATVRSRNFRVHVVGQSLEKTPSGRYRVKATRKRSYRVFVNRGEEGAVVIDPSKVKVDVLHEINL
jgi:hypothetical protein